MQLLSFLTSVQHAGEFHAPDLYPQRKRPRCPSNTRLGRTRSRSGRTGEEINLLSVKLDQNTTPSTFFMSEWHEIRELFHPILTDKGNVSANSGTIFWCTIAGQQTRLTRFVQIVSELELQWLFTEWDVFATSLDMFAHVLATHGTSCKWLRLLSWLQQVVEVTRTFMSQ